MKNKFDLWVYSHPTLKKLIMELKIAFLITLVSVSTVLANPSYAQIAKVSLDMENKSLEQVMDKIESQSEFYFIFNQKQIDVNRVVSVQAENKLITDILPELFKGTNVNYVVLDRKILLTTDPIENNILAIASTTEPQQKQITGTVTNETGNPLPGVNVAVKGTTLGVLTDISGKYTINNAPQNAILIFSFIGMTSQEISSEGRMQIDVVLKEASIGLDEVVVVGYGSSKRRDITGAISTVKSDALTLTPVASTTNALTGKVPGLQTLQGTGEPGNDASKLSIRGFGNALIIVDGVEQSFNNISASEIESISVLKDASAAIYGARAGNGVILVTTKRGVTGKPAISFNSSYTYSGNINYPKAMNAGQYTEIYREAQLNTGVAPALTKYSEADIRNYYAGTNPDSTSTDWWKATMNNWAPMQKYDLSLRGGNENVRYYAFAGYTRQDGMFKTGDNVYDQFNVRSNIDATVAKNLTMELNLSAIIGDLSRSAQGIQEGGQFWNTFFWARPVNPAFLPDNSKIAYSGGPLALNPVINTSKEIGGYNQVNSQNIRGSMGLKYDIPGIKGLYVKAFGDYQSYSTDDKTFSKFVQTYTHSFASGIYTKQLATGPTSLNETMSPGYIFTGQFSVNYSRIFNANHEVSGIILYEMISSYGKWMQTYRRDFLSTAIDYLFAGSSNTQQNNGSATESGRASLIGRLNYKFKNKYLAEVTIRYDGSPNFPANTRWGFFPSISGGWIISDESFVKDNVNWLSNLKLRASYSNTGYDNVGAFQYIAGFTMGQRPFALNGLTQTGIAISGIPNPNITWEQMNTYDAGLDFSLFNNTLYGEADVFYRLRDGILGTRVLSLPSTFGATLPSENINSMDTRGMEFLVGLRKSVGDLSFDISGNISWARSKWIHFDEPEYTDPDDIRINKKSGAWTDLIWGYKTDGLFTSQAAINNLGYDIDGTGNSTVKVGDIKYLNLNGDTKLDWRDYTVIGKSGLPKTMFGLNFRLGYKGFDLEGLFQGAAGRTLNVTQGMISEQNNTQNLFNYRWTEENPDKNAIYPRQSFNSNNFKISDYWLINGTYVRLKVLTIGYNLPKQLIDKIGIDNFRFYVSGTNLFTFSGLEKYNIDPENPGENAVGFGVPGAVYPHQRTITVGLNMSF
jgi:TonB-linked SusC/RagA family outer membrane protein